MGNGGCQLHDALDIIRDLRQHLTHAVLASPEDASYFRTLYKKKSSEEKIPDPIPAKPTRTPPKPAPVPIQPAVSAPPLPAPAPQKLPAPVPQPLEKKKENLTSFFNLLGTLAPHFPLLKEIPSDERAKKIANRWKTKNQSAPISILSFSEPTEHKQLLEQITCAIDIYYGPARLLSVESIEKEKQWEAFLSVKDLKLILCCDYTLWQLNDLMRHFKEIPTSGKRLLGQVPLFLLPDLTLYLKDPSLKRSLWKALCQTITSL